MNGNNWWQSKEPTARQLPERFLLGLFEPWPEVDATYDGLLAISEPSTYRVRRGPPSGVYFLIKDRSVIYVGQSRFVENRVETHRRTKAMEFDEWRWIPCRPLDLLSLEAIHIHAWIPKFNKDKCAELARARRRQQEADNAI